MFQFLKLIKEQMQKRENKIDWIMSLFLDLDSRLRGNDEVARGNDEKRRRNEEII